MQHGFHSVHICVYVCLCRKANLADWLSHLSLSQYYQVLVQNGYENIDFISDISLEDLQEIGITKLGKSPRVHIELLTLFEVNKI